jgi:NADH:ubiquinone oxidoreductase subunit K
MDDLLLNQFLLLGAVLFCIGVYGVLARRNAVMVLMSIELVLNAVNINLLAFGAMRTGEAAVTGQVFALFVITIAAAEVGVGLAIVLLIYRNRTSVDFDEVSAMKG